MDHVILNHGQVTWTTPELAPPLLTTTPHQREDVSALDRFSVHRCPTRGALAIVRVQYFVRGEFVGHRSRASSKHLSVIFRSTGLDSSGSKRGCAAAARCTCECRVHKEADRC
ncbi:uncharacterized protein TNCV_4730771 [Trichonephila clavipes]|nr:uncharacterized protein TNCV_4730771 [Trichonephila clavipes]